MKKTIEVTVDIPDGYDVGDITAVSIDFKDCGRVCHEAQVYLTVEARPNRFKFEEGGAYWTYCKDKGIPVLENNKKGIPHDLTPYQKRRHEKNYVSGNYFKTRKEALMYGATLEECAYF